MLNNPFKNPKVMRFVSISIFQVAIIYLTVLMLNASGFIEEFLSIQTQLIIVVSCYILSYLFSKYTCHLYEIKNNQEKQKSIIESKLFSQTTSNHLLLKNSKIKSKVTDSPNVLDEKIKKLERENKKLKKQIKTLQATPMNWKGSFLSYNVLMEDILSKIFYEKASHDDLKMVYTEFENKIISEYDSEKHGNIVADSITQAWSYFPDFLKYNPGQRPPKKAKSDKK